MPPKDESVVYAHLLNDYILRRSGVISDTVKNLQRLLRPRSNTIVHLIVREELSVRSTVRTVSGYQKNNKATRTYFGVVQHRGAAY